MNVNTTCLYLVTTSKLWIQNDYKFGVLPQNPSWEPTQNSSKSSQKMLGTYDRNHVFSSQKKIPCVCICWVRIQAKLFNTKPGQCSILDTSRPLLFETLQNINVWFWQCLFRITVSCVFRCKAGCELFFGFHRPSIRSLSKTTIWMVSIGHGAASLCPMGTWKELTYCENMVIIRKKQDKNKTRTTGPIAHKKKQNAPMNLNTTSENKMGTELSICCRPCKPQRYWSNDATEQTTEQTFAMLP